MSDEKPGPLADSIWCLSRGQVQYEHLTEADLREALRRLAADRDYWIRSAQTWRDMPKK